MTSYIFNSKTVSRYLAVILVTAGFLCAFEYAVRRYEHVDWFHIRTQLDKRKPDIILVGNSMLQTHIDKKMFEDKLSALAGRKIQAYFITKPGCAMATFYLILKYQIAQSHLSGIPVGIVDFTEGNLLSIGLDGTERGQIKLFMPQNDAYFLSHYYDTSLSTRAWLRPFCQSCYFSPEFSRSAISTAAVGVLSRLGVGGNPAGEVKTRFAQIGGLENKMAQEKTYLPQAGASISENISRSFLPPSIDIMKRFKLFFVITHHAPREEAPPTDSSHSVIAYLASSSVPTIDMRDDATLSVSDYYSDRIHATKKGQVAATNALAQDVYKLGLIH